MRTAKKGSSLEESNATPTSLSISANDRRNSSSMELSILASENFSLPLSSSLKISWYASPNFANCGSSWVAICWIDDEIVAGIDCVVSATVLATFPISVAKPEKSVISSSLNLSCKSPLEPAALTKATSIASYSSVVSGIPFCAI